MKILVMGGTRFFGRHLVQMLTDAQHEVHLFSRGLTPDTFGDCVQRDTMEIVKTPWVSDNRANDNPTKSSKAS